MASNEEKETYLYKPAFKQLWQKEVRVLAARLSNCNWWQSTLA